MVSPTFLVDLSASLAVEELGFDDTALIGVLDALRRYYEQNPTLARLEIQVIADDA